MVNKNTEQVELELVDIERIWDLFYQRLRQGAISKETGLPVPLVRAVLFGRYSLKGDKAVVNMPTIRVGKPQSSHNANNHGWSRVAK